MNDGADDNAIAIIGVEYDVRLKPKASVPALKVVGGLSDAGKIREEAESAFETSEIGIRLIG